MAAGNVSSTRLHTPSPVQHPAPQLEADLVRSLLAVALQQGAHQRQVSSRQARQRCEAAATTQNAGMPPRPPQNRRPPDAGGCAGAARQAPPHLPGGRPQDGATALQRPAHAPAAPDPAAERPRPAPQRGPSPRSETPPTPRPAGLQGLTCVVPSEGTNSWVASTLPATQACAWRLRPTGSGIDTSCSLARAASSWCLASVAQWREVLVQAGACSQKARLFRRNKPKHVPKRHTSSPHPTPTRATPAHFRPTAAAHRRLARGSRSSRTAN